MVKVLVFINTEPGREREVIARLREVNGVKEVYSMYGVYDIVATVEVGSVDQVKQIIYATIRRIEGILSAMSMIVIEGKG